jgi:crotonobetainyl-CoA:carnitine CoA-transferase CaiB-like acyl-CoA transferase
MTIHPDHLAGRLVALGAVAGLLARERTGVGSRIDIAQFEAVSMLIGDLLLAESLQPGAAQPVGNASADHAPWGLFRCADDSTGAESWLAVCVPDDETWSSLTSVASAMDRPEWRTEAGRVGDRERVDAAVAAWLRDVDAPGVEGSLQAAGVPAGQVIHPRLLVDHPLYVGRGYPVPVDQPGSGPLLLEGPAMTSTRMGVPRCEPAPLLGEHTAEVLGELLGIDDDGLAALVSAGAIDPLPST